MTRRPAFVKVLLICPVAPVAAYGKIPQRTLKASVRFLSTSTSFRTGFGESQDVYLVAADLQPQSGEWALARLVDEFPPYRTSLPSRDLQSGSPTTLCVRRDASCDVAYAQMRLRTAPGDPMAILPEPLGFIPILDQPARPTELLPCYRTVRK